MILLLFIFRALILGIGLQMTFGPVQAQENNPVHWQFSSRKINDKVFEVHLTATIDAPWHIYSQQLAEDAIALPTTISFNKNPLITFHDKPREVGKLIEEKDEALGITLRYYSDKVVFVQTLQLKAAAKTNISGSIRYMACVDDRCLPEARQSFTVTLE